METIHGLNSNGPAIIGTGVVFTVLSITAVGLRFVSKRITRASVGIDDWLLLLALLIFVTAEILVIRSDIIGRQATSPDDQRYKTYLQYVYIYSAFTFPIIALSQISILCFYRNLFYPSHLRQTTLVLIGIVVSWLIAALVIEIGYPGHTIGSYFPGSSEVVFKVTYLDFWLSMNVIEAVVELVILILPIRELHKLQLSTSKKRLLSLIFSLGGFVVITGIVRMAVIYRPNLADADFDLTQGDIWLNVHIGTVIISACLPTYRPLISRAAQLVHTTLSTVSNHGGSYKNNTYNSDDTYTLRNTAEKGRRRGVGEEGDMERYLGQSSGTFTDARRSEDGGRESDAEGVVGADVEEAVRAGEAIGVRKTVEVV